MSNCASCKFSEILVKEGDPYSFLNQLGEEITRIHEANVLLCRAMPPIAGAWPQVSPDDWCGQGDFD